MFLCIQLFVGLYVKMLLSRTYREENAKTIRKALYQCLTKKFKHFNAGNTWLEKKILTLKRTNGETL